MSFYSKLAAHNARSFSNYLAICLFQVYMAQVFESFKNIRKFLLLLGYQSEKLKNK
jgi:hypothetical protein